MVERPNPRRIRWYRRAAFVAAVAAVGGWPGPAPAFYWLGWPGSGLQPPPGIVSDTVKVDHRNPPPTTNPPDTNPPGGGPNNPPPDHPNEVPEPATLLLAGAGLAATAGLRWARKRRNPNP